MNIVYVNAHLILYIILNKNQVNVHFWLHKRVLRLKFRQTTKPFEFKFYVKHLLLSVLGECFMTLRSLGFILKRSADIFDA